MEIKRDVYLNELILRLHNGMIKVITGIRRCGKSYLMNTFFTVISLNRLPMIHISSVSHSILRKIWQESAKIP